MRWKRRLELAAVAVLVVVYSLLSHYSNSHTQARTLGLGLTLTPICMLAMVLLWRWRGVAAVSVGAIAAAIIVHRYWPLLERNFQLLYFAQQFGFYGLMALTFGMTLKRPLVPLCTLLADKVHGPLDADALRYTRKVTAAWTLFFVANMIATSLLYAFAPLWLWSAFVNFCSLPLVALMFAAEYAVRRRVLPRVRSGGLMATLRVYFADSH